MTEPETDDAHVLICRACDDEVHHWFFAEGLRLRWSVEHTRETGHEDWIVWDYRYGGPDPEVVPSDGYVVGTIEHSA